MTYRRRLVSCCLAIMLVGSTMPVDGQTHWVHVNRRSPINLNLVDLNSASKDELLSLPSIGSAQADAIIKGRPYETKRRLLDAKILTKEEYERVEKRVTTISAPAKG